MSSWTREVEHAEEKLLEQPYNPDNGLNVEFSSKYPKMVDEKVGENLTENQLKIIN